MEQKYRDTDGIISPALVVHPRRAIFKRGRPIEVAVLFPLEVSADIGRREQDGWSLNVK
jgi:hypothetical protein